MSDRHILTDMHQRIIACPTPPTFSGISQSVTPMTFYILLGSASPTPISTDYARQKHNDSAERIYFLSSARLRVFFKWSYAVPTILMLLLVSDKNPQGQTLTKDIINSFMSA